MMSSRELARRVVHILLGGGAFLLPEIGWSAAAGACALATVANAWLLPRWQLSARLLRPGESPGHAGLVLYPGILFVLLVIFRDSYVPVQAAWLALAVGDGTAPWFGSRMRRPRWPRSNKSVPASFAASGLAGCAMLGAMPALPAFGAAGLAALGDAQDFVDDNVAIPALAAIGAWIGLLAT